MEGQPDTNIKQHSSFKEKLSIIIDILGILIVPLIVWTVVSLILSGIILLTMHLLGTAVTQQLAIHVCVGMATLIIILTTLISKLIDPYSM